MGFYDRNELFTYSKEKALKTILPVVSHYSLGWFYGLAYSPIFQ